jgi:cyclomaltodextrinase
MIDHPEQETVDEISTSAIRDIASAPGIPDTADIEQRFLALERQFRHDNTFEPLAPVPGQPVTVKATSGSGLRLRRAALYYTTDSSAPSAESPRIVMTVSSVSWDYRIGYLTTWDAVIPSQVDGTIVRYRIGGWRSGAERTEDAAPDVWAHDGQGFWFRVPGEAGITTFAYRVAARRAVMPAWMDEAVIYHIFLDRFHPGNDDGVFHGDLSPRERHGGTLGGVHRALPYIADLGVTCIWLSPIHPAETYHRYDTMDYFAVDPALGTSEEFRDLVEAAHERGIRVLLDFVPSHASWHHPAFLAAQRDRDAPTASWFVFDRWPDQYRCFLQVSPYLPTLNTADPGARAHLIASAVHWIREFGVDGFRLDHVIAPGMDFWVAFLAAVEGASPQAVTIGEATDTPDSLRRYRGKLQSTLDFELAAALRLTFGTGNWNVGLLEYLIASYERFMAEGPGRVSFLDNHDMDRFLWVAGNDEQRLKLAALCQFTLAPTPSIYYGTEIGLTQEHGASELGFGGDAQARRDMLWDPARWNWDLVDFYRRLIRFRHAHPGLSRTARTTIHLDERANTWAYARVGAGQQSETIVAAFNLGRHEAELELDIAGNLELVLGVGPSPEIDGRRVRLPACSGAVFQLR